MQIYHIHVRAVHILIKNKLFITDINECSNNPCKNGATCVDLVGSYRCDCKTGYSGTNCQTGLTSQLNTLKFVKNALFFNSLLGVWKCGQTRSFMFDILLCGNFDMSIACP